MENLNINGMTEIDDVLKMIADKIVLNDKDGAIDSINELRDHFEEQSAESQTVFADARDQHLINQNFKKALGQ